MIKKIITLIMLVSVLVPCLFAEKYAGEIFKIGAGVRNFSMGRAGVTDIKSPALAYWNSSLLLVREHNAFELMHAEEFNGLLKYDTFSGSFGENNKIGFTLARIGVNDIKLTGLANPSLPVGPDNPPEIIDRVNTQDYILYLGFARYLGKVPLGFTPKLVYRDLAGVSAFGFGLDLSTFIQAYEYFTFGFRLRDIVPAQIFWDDGVKESVATGLDFEMQIHTFMPVIDKPLNLYVNGEFNSDNMISTAKANAGILSLDPHLGAELILHNSVSLFAGYDINNFTTGIEVNYNQFLLNYSFEQDTELDNSHRLSIGYKF